jgi:protein associated with RNAse G/E
LEREIAILEEDKSIIAEQKERAAEEVRNFFSQEPVMCYFMSKFQISFSAVAKTTRRHAEVEK